MDWIFKELWGGVKPYVIKIFAKIKIRNRVKKVSSEVKKAFLYKLGNREYFNELDRYLSNNKIFYNFISNCNSTGIHEYTTINEYIEIHADRFIKENPIYYLEKNSIKKALAELFSLIFNRLNKIENDELRSLTNILKEHTANLETLLNEVDKKIDKLEEKMDRASREIIELIGRGIDGDKALTLETISAVLTTPFVAPEIDVKQLCQRSTVVNMIIEESKRNDWVHLKGSAWSGKTSLALLLKEKITNSLWIDFSIGNPISILKSFEVVFNNPISKLEISSVIIDNLPQIVVANNLTPLISSFINKLNRKGIKIITLGVHSIPNVFLIDKQISFKDIDIQEFSKEDVRDMMLKMKAPKYLTEGTASEFVLELAGKKPAAIAIMLQYLKFNNWDINSESFLKIITLDIKELKEQINSILTATIKDEKTRELLYRISFVGHIVHINDLIRIANIKPKINLVGERLNDLRGIWLNGDKTIDVNGVLRNLSSDNLSDDIKMNINNIIADSIIAKHTLDQLDVTRLICHLVGAKRIDEAGYIYISAMQSLCEDNIEYNDTFMFAKMWRETPLPAEMNVTIKARIRLLQILYDVQNNEENDFIIDDLIKIAKHNAIARELIVAGGAILITKNHHVAMKLIKSASEFGLPQTYHFEDTLSNSPNVMLVPLMLYSAKNLKDAEDWFNFVKTNTTDSIINDLESLKYAHFFAHGFERVRTNINHTDLARFVKLVEEVFEFAINKNWYILASGCATTLLRIKSINESDYSATKTSFENNIQKVNDLNYTSNLNLWMGIIAIDHKDYEYAKPLLLKASMHAEKFNAVDNIICYINCAIAFSNIGMHYEACASITQALMTAANCKDHESISSDLIFRIHFEKLICYYLADDFGNALDSLEYINQYFEDNGTSGNEHFISIASHCITYIQADLLKHNPPKKLGNEAYTVPYAGFMWSQDDNKRFIGLNINARKSMINLYSSLLFNRYGKTELENKWFDISFNNTEVFNDLGFICGLALDGFSILKLLENKKYSLVEVILSKIAKQPTSSSGDNMLLKINLIKITFFLLANIDRINEVLPQLKLYNMPESVSSVWNAWIENIENSFNETCFEALIKKGNDCAKVGDYLSHIANYCFATTKANLYQWTTVYLSILSGIDIVILNDVFWKKHVLLKLLKNQLLAFREKNEIDAITLEAAEKDLNLYSFDASDIKLFFKKIVGLFNMSDFQKDHIAWLT